MYNERRKIEESDRIDAILDVRQEEAKWLPCRQNYKE